MAFVIFVACAVGGFLMIAALLNLEWVFGIGPELEIVEKLFGESAARWLCGLVGLAVIGAVIVGWATRR